jgi:type VI secretion system secreted protein Hcp
MTAEDYFLKITGLQGESRDATHKDEIEIDSWGWGLSKPAATGPGAVGRATFQEFSILKKVDRSSPALAQACVKGEHFQEAVLSARRAEGPNFSIDFLVIRLSDITISSYEEAGASQSAPMDSIEIAFSKIEYSYNSQKADGTLDAPVKWSWDLKANRTP